MPENVVHHRITKPSDLDRIETLSIINGSGNKKFTRIKLDEVNNFSGGDINLDGVVDLNQWIRVADGSPVIRHQEWNTLWSYADSLNLAQLVLQNEKKTGQFNHCFFKNNTKYHKQLML